MIRPLARGSPATWAALALALAWTILLARLHVEGGSSPLDRFEEVGLDLRNLLAPKQPPPAAVLVAIDDAMVQQAGRYPLSRTTLASIIAAATRQGAKSIAVDLLLVDSGPAEADAALAQALREAPAVIAAAGLFDDQRRAALSASSAGAMPAPARLLWPAAPLAAAAEIGIVNLAPGFGGTPRHAPLLFRGPGGIVPSFVLLAAALTLGASPAIEAEAVTLGGRRVALDLGQTLALRFYGPKGTIPTIGAAALLGPSPPDLSGRTVVIGATATGIGDTFPTPFATVMPGAEVLATAVDNLLAGDALVRTRLTRWIDAGAAAVLALGAVALIGLRRTVIGLAMVPLLAAAWLTVTQLAFDRGVWLSMALPLAAMLPAAAGFGALRLWQERRTALHLARVERGLRPFQPRPISDLLAANPGFLDAPVVQDAAVLFVDLAGYTAMSERIDAVRMRDLLKGFHAIVDAAVDAQGGFVATFMGDGAMALFGCPTSRPDDAARALAATMDLDARLRRWGEAQGAGLAADVRARLSAHYGPVVLSRLGGDSHQQITATGDTVNVASRLQDVAKQTGAGTVISDALFRAAGATAPAARFPTVRAMAIRGRSGPAAVRLLDDQPLPP